MRHLVLLLAMALFTVPQYTIAQENYSVTLSVDPQNADWENFPGWVTFYGEMYGPELDLPVEPRIQISYQLNDTVGEPDGFIGVFESSYNQESGSYSIAFELLGGEYQSASTIYLRGEILWLDWATLELYAQYETHPDSIIEIQLPWLVTGVDQEGASEVFSAYPNPTAGELSLSGLGNAKSVSIHDMFGRVVMTTPAYQRMDVRHLAPGTYVLRTDSGLVHRFVKS